MIWSLLVLEPHSEMQCAEDLTLCKITICFNLREGYAVTLINQVGLTPTDDMYQSALNRHDARTGMKMACAYHNLPHTMRWAADIQLVRVCAISPMSLGRGGVRCLLCKMEMSLPRFAVAKLFWNGSHQKTLGRAGKLGHLQDQGSRFFREASLGDG